MKFKIDENLPIEIANLFKEDGHDALTVLGQHLGGQKDSKIIEVCQN